MAELPPLPPGFTLDQPQSQPQAQSLPPLPPGFTLDQPGQPAPRDPRPSGSLYDAVEEPIASLGSSAIAAPVAGLVGLGAMGTRALGLTNADPADVVRSVQSAMTYQPRTKAGQVGTDVVSYPFEKLAQGADYVGGKVADVTGSPALGAGTNAALQFAPSLLLKGRGKAGVVAEDVRPSTVPADNAPATRTPSAAAEVPAQAQRAGGLESVPATPAENPAIQVARDAGYKLKPSETGKAPVGTVVEGLTGSAKLETSLAIKNQRRTNELVQQELGLPKGNISPESLQELKKPYNAVYKKVEQLGEVTTDEQYTKDVNSIGRTPGTSFSKDTNPAIEKLREAYADEPRFNSADAVLKIRTLRRKGNLNIKSRDPEAQELGYAQREVADALEGQLERHVASTGDADLIQRFQDARVQLAKINTVEAALKGGDISAPILAKMLEKKVPLSGNLKTIAEVAQTFPNVMREGRKIKNAAPVNMYESTLGLAGAVTANPALAAGMVARPITRAVLTSDMYQNALARRSGVGRSAPKKPPLKLEKPKRNKLAEF